MSYPGAAILVLFLLGLTSAGWYWLFKRFERRMSERFDDVTERINENFRFIEMLVNRLYQLPVTLDKTNEKLAEMILKDDLRESKLDLAQGLLLVIKQELALDKAMAECVRRREEGRISEEEAKRLIELIENMRLENMSRH